MSAFEGEGGFRLDSFLPEGGRYSDEELGRFLASVGNHEAKALLIAGMEENKIYLKKSLTSRLVRLQGPKPGWIPSSRLGFNYCTKSLGPIGLVVEGRNNFGYMGYSKTPKGCVVGTSFAGHMLEFSEASGTYSLEDLLGPSKSPNKIEVADPEIESPDKKRSPLTHFRMFWALLTSNLPKSQSDLADTMGVSQGSLEEHLRALKAKKVITYQPGQPSKPSSLYRLSSERALDSPQPYRRYVRSTRDVYELAQQMGVDWFKPSDLAARLKLLYSERGLSTSTYKEYSSGLLTHLANAGYLEKKTLGEEEVLSEITLTNEQVVLLTRFVKVVDAFQDLTLDYLIEGLIKARKIIANPDRVSTLMKKAQEHSSQANAKPRDKRLEVVGKILEDNPGATTAEILAILAENQYTKLSKGSVNGYLRQLADDGIAIFTLEVGIKHWQIVN